MRAFEGIRDHNIKFHTEEKNAYEEPKNCRKKNKEASV